jgi:hypothetical protein
MLHHYNQELHIGKIRAVRLCTTAGTEALLNCFESPICRVQQWMFGYRPTFGLIAVDRATQTRTVKPSARWLGEVARANGFQIDTLTVVSA